ncbi:hypothetical protein GOODEAATRI_033206, partial [Goodea atripinnis]
IDCDVIALMDDATLARQSTRQAQEERDQRSPFWDTRLARPLPGTGPLRYYSSPSSHRQPRPPATTNFQHRRSQPGFAAARFLSPVQDSSPPPLHSPCSVPAPSHRRRRRRRDASVPVSEGCANASSSLPEGWTTAFRLFPRGPCSTPPLLLLRRVGSTPRSQQQIRLSSCLQ